jgi:TolB protein
MRTGPPSPPGWWPASRTWLFLLAGLLVLAACSESAEITTTTAGATTSTPPDTSAGTGRLAILDAEGNVAVVDPDGSNLEQITSDAGPENLYTQPLWSPDAAALVWGRATGSGFSVVLHDIGDNESRSITTANLPFYMSWSPDGSRLGVLHNGEGGIDFNLVDVEGTTIMRVDNGAPYYFSWRPDGGLLVTHVGVDKVETIDPAGNRTPAAATGPAYLSPQWTDVGIYHVVDDALVLENDSGDREPVAEVEGLVMFVASPDGSRVALQTTGGDDAIDVGLAETPEVPSGNVVVLDVSTGSVETVSDQPALGFFWSPDGSSLLTLIPGEDALEPSVWRDGDTREYDGYIPPGTMLQDTFPFFPQYAQSIVFWAPDSSAFTFAGAIGDEVGIWVQHLDAASPARVAEGRWVTWSS